MLIVAGSDSGGGAGIQADIKAVTALGGYAMTAIAALTAQNTLGVFGVMAVPVEFVQQQMRLVLSDIGADCVKLGMLANSGIINAVADVLEAEGRGIALVADPVMVAKGGANLLDPEAVSTYKRRLPILTTLLTPNVPEAEALTGLTIRDRLEMRHAAEMLLTLGPQAVLLKGGHMEGDTVIDMLATVEGIEEIRSPRLDTPNTHGTGCTLASAIAAGLAQGLSLSPAVHRGIRYVHEAIATAPGLGTGHGPLNHVHTVRPFSGQ